MLMTHACRAAVSIPLAVGLAACNASSAEHGQSSTPVTAQTSTRPATAPGAADPVWHYEGAAGPEHWGALSSKFVTCRDGHSQSPIDIAGTVVGTDALEIKTDLLPASLRIAHHAHVADGINNGHTIQVNYQGTEELTIGTDTYALVQYHFHDPSEHTIKGKRYPMEMHLVHRARSGALAVIGVLIEEGPHNPTFDPIWNNLPRQTGVETHYPSVSVDVDRLLPGSRTSYRYNGSLTTPPCSEGVRWIVMTTPITLSADQIKAFTSIVRDNSRPTQPLNGRPVLTEPVSLTP